MGRKDSKRHYVSASEIGRFAYCPLSWYLEYIGKHGRSKGLKEGKRLHDEISRDLHKVEESTGNVKEGERIIALFSFVSIVLVLNAIVVVEPRYFIIGTRDFSSMLITFLAVLWMALALVFYLHSRTLRRWTLGLLIPTHPQKKVVVPHKKGMQRVMIGIQRVLKPKTALAIIGTSVVLIFNGYLYLVPLDKLLWGRILVVSALLWLIGSTAILYLVMRTEEKLGGSKRSDEALVMAFSIVSTVLAINAITMNLGRNVSGSTDLGQAMITAASFWLFIGIFVMIYSFVKGVRILEKFTGTLIQSKKIRESDVVQATKEEEKAAGIFALVALALSINALFINLSPNMAVGQIAMAIAVIWLVAAGSMMVFTIRSASIAAKMRAIYRLDGDMIYYDMDGGPKKPPLLISEQYGITGRPDIVIRNGSGGLVPIEVKTGHVPRIPYFSHIVQVGAYCLLISEHYGEDPPYGIIRYQIFKDNKAEETSTSKTNGSIIMGEYKIAYDRKMKELILGIVKDIRDIMDGRAEAHRNHENPRKCLHCSRYHLCPERMEP